MKKLLFASALIAAGSSAAFAQAIEQPGFFDNWSMGVEGGVTTPVYHQPFFKSMRPVVGLHVAKQVTPVLAVGAEGQFGINTSSWAYRRHSSTAFDDSYVGLYGALDLFNLFGGYNGQVRPFTIELQGGAGWGHTYLNDSYKPGRKDHNYIGAKAGLNFNFNVSDNVTLNISPSVYGDISDFSQRRTNPAYNNNKLTFNVEAGVTYNFGGHDFNVVEPYNQAEIDALNAQINGLRAELAGAVQGSADWQAKADALQAQLAECQNRPAEVVKEVQDHNYLNSVRFVFFKIGSSAVTNDQMPNVEMIADYMKSHPQSTVVIKGYASKDGNLDFNIKLAQKRAEAVKNMLVNRFKIKASRITAEGEGIGQMFDEESWNRVSICTLESQE